jgi:hypothetical protein
MDKGKGKKAKGKGSPFSIAEMHIFKLNPTLLKVKGSCSRKVLHLGECSKYRLLLETWNSPDTRNIPCPRSLSLHSLLFPLSAGQTYSPCQ